MRIHEIISLIESDREHGAELEKTGFWGKQGAGALILAKDTGRFCIAHRSAHVEQPGTWGTWGGAMDSGETPLEAAHRELHEETGYSGASQFIPLYVFNHPSGFRYSNFLAVVPSEFAPQMDWETQGYKWVKFGDWPEPMHFGMKSILADGASVERMKQQLPKVAESKMKDLAYDISHGAPNPLEKTPIVNKQSALLKSFALKSGKDIENVRAVWNNAKQKYGNNWALVTANTKRELGI